ncbi:MAG TPA: M56 family metallopeptidase, partial [Gemmataceae bacterium]|nr:M56 family metallopeptidase [Gemmataceae bacterium]
MMNNLGRDFIWLAVQVTFTSLLGLAGYALARRRGPERATRVLTLYLGLLILFALGAFLPFPAIWKSQALPAATTEMISQTPSNAPADAVDIREDRPASQNPERPLLESALSWFHALGADRAADAGPTSQASRRWFALIGWTYLAIWAVGCVRLLFANWFIGRLRNRSRPILNEYAQDQLAALAGQLGCRRMPRLAESSELSGPALVGWRDPLILLPANWSAWSRQDLDAVLAHELAHVARGDFVSTCIGRLSLALHFYHPLVHWLASRLRFEQEMAADLVGARLAGGRQAYVRVLARMALGSTKQPAAWPAQAFLSGPGTITRRIIMLQKAERIPERSCRWLLNSLAGVLLFLAALGVVALRAQAQDSAKTDSAGLAVTSTSNKQPSTRFELPVVGPQTLGIISFRPAEFLALPGMKQHANLMNMMLAETMQLTYCGLAVPREGDNFDPNLRTEEGTDFVKMALPLDEIELVVGSIRLLRDPKAPQGHRNSIYPFAHYIRSVHPVDWIALLQPTMGELEECK